MTPGQKLLQHARKDSGIREIPGEQDHPRILRAINLAAEWLDDGIKDADGKIAWCGCILGLWLFELAYGTPAAHYRAASYLNYGEPVKYDNLQPGDIIVMKRPGGNHVTMFVKFVPGGFVAFGGNQSDSVNEQQYAKDRFTGGRRITDAMVA